MDSDFCCEGGAGGGETSVLVVNEALICGGIAVVAAVAAWGSPLLRGTSSISGEKRTALAIALALAAPSSSAVYMLGSAGLGSYNIKYEHFSTYNFVENTQIDGESFSPLQELYG